VFLDSIAQIRRTPNIAQWNEIETRAEPLVEDWYFHPGTPKSPLQQDVSLATQNLLGRAAKP
jgi:hypothetical protein